MTTAGGVTVAVTVGPGTGTVAAAGWTVRRSSARGTVAIAPITKMAMRTFVSRFMHRPYHLGTGESPKRTRRNRWHVRLMHSAQSLPARRCVWAERSCPQRHMSCGLFAGFLAIQRVCPLLLVFRQNVDGSGHGLAALLAGGAVGLDHAPQGLGEVLDLHRLECGAVRGGGPVLAVLRQHVHVTAPALEREPLDHAFLVQFGQGGRSRLM